MFSFHTPNFLRFVKSAVFQRFVAFYSHDCLNNYVVSGHSMISPNRLLFRLPGFRYLDNDVANQGMIYLAICRTFDHMIGQHTLTEEIGSQGEYCQKCCIIRL